MRIADLEGRSPLVVLGADDRGVDGKDRFIAASGGQDAG
jgi:hypothetical protein